MKNGVLFLLTWLAALAASGAQSPPTDNGPQNEIPFELSRNFGSILIRAQVNGMPVTLIVDTGSSNTILSTELPQLRPLLLEHAPSPDKESGLIGRAEWSKATIEVGTIKWPDRKILVMNDFQEISNSLKQKVDGIVGLDLLSQFDSLVIDFKHHRLIFSHS